MKKKILITVIVIVCLVIVGLVVYNYFKEEPNFENYNQNLVVVDQEEDNKNVEDVKTLFLNSDVLPTTITVNDIMDCMRISDYYVLYVNKTDTEMYLVTYKDGVFTYDTVLKADYIQMDIPENIPEIEY